MIPLVLKEGKRVVTCVLLGSWLIPFLFSGGEKAALYRLALQEQRRKAAIEVEGRKYRNEDLKRLPNARVGIARFYSREAKQRPPGASPPADLSQTSRDAWLTAAGQARNRLLFAVNRSHVLQLRCNHLRNLYLNESEESRRELLRAELADGVAALGETEREEEGARAEWEDLLKEAKRAGVTAAELGRFQEGIDRSTRVVGFRELEDQD